MFESEHVGLSQDDDAALRQADSAGHGGPIDYAKGPLAGDQSDAGAASKLIFQVNDAVLGHDVLTLEDQYFF